MKITGTEWRELFNLLDTLLDLSEAERAEELGRIGREAPEVRTKLEKLLADTEDGLGVDAMQPLFTDRPAFAVGNGRFSLPMAFEAGSEVGPYRLLREIGHGGMSTVWLVNRSDGQMQRDIALKLPHIFLHQASFSERFSRERDILAALTHPNIARLYDAGISHAGQPYLAMEYVEGAPLLEHCDTRRLSVDARVELFLQVLDAVRYAHSKLVLHRDLKPSNILVTAAEQVRLLDFGIAKLIVDGAVNETELTHLGGRALTLAYASPEQVGGRPLGTASDVYSLGVILSELLTGARPYRLQNDSRGALEDAIRIERPQRLSQTVHVDQAARCDTVLSKLVEQLRGDLEAIVTKALRKEPELRYQTVDALRADLVRRQRGEPVEARHGARGYVFGRFVRRHRLLVSAAAMGLILVATGVSGIAWQEHQARREAMRADVEAKKANAVKDFLLDIFKQSSLRNPSGAQARHVTAEQLLDIGAQRIKVQLRDEPEVRGELLDTLGQLYGELGFPGRNAELQMEHLAGLQVRDKDPATSVEAARAEMRLGKALNDDGKADDAGRHLEAALKILDSLNDRQSLDRAQVLLTLADTAYYSKAIDNAAARKTLLEALDIVDRHYPTDPLRGDITRTLGSYAKLVDDFPDAEHWEREALASRRSLGVEKNGYAIGDAYFVLGDTLALDNQYEEAETDLLRAIELLTRSAGPDHFDTAEAKSRLGEMYAMTSRPAKGAELLLQALESQRKTPQGFIDSTETIKTLAQLELQRGGLAESEQWLRQNLNYLHTIQSNELRYGLSASHLVPVLAARGKFVEADHYNALAKQILARYLGETTSGYERHLFRAAFLSRMRGEPELAVRQETAILDNDPQVRSKLPAETLLAEAERASLTAQRGSSIDESLATIDGVLQRILSAPDHEYHLDDEADVRYLFGTTLIGAGRGLDAEPHLRRAIEIREKIDNPDSVWLARSRVALAQCLIQRGAVAEARVLLQNAERAERKQSPLAAGFHEQLRAAVARLKQAS